MPVAHESAPATSAPRSLAARLAGFAGMAIAALVVLACGVLLAVRYVVLPRVEAWRPEIAERLTRALGAPVTIDGLATGWDGWNPKLVVTGVAVHDRAGGLERTAVAHRSDRRHEELRAWRPAVGDARRRHA